MDRDVVAQALAEWGERPYRLGQARQAQRAGAREWDEVTTLPAALRARLAAAAPLWTLRPDDERTSRDGTVKWRFALTDGRVVEAVLIAHAQGRRTLCVSSQVGCALGCRFCATGSLGFGRDLSRWEILDQVLFGRLAAEAQGARLSNVVFMGMGEPMQNLGAVLAACDDIHAPEGAGISARGIAISTAGWVPGIEQLAEHPLPVRLAISLHAADDETRGRLMPINNRYPIANLLAACRRYCDRTGRRVFIEYLLLDSVNDAPADARRLASLLRDGRFHVNLIEYNPTDGGYASSRPERREAFMGALSAAGIAASLRRSRGADVDAACGQLAARTATPPAPAAAGAG